MRLPPAPPARDRRQAPRESPSAKRDSLGNIPPSAATAKPALLLTCGLRDNALVYKLLCYEKLIGVEISSDFSFDCFQAGENRAATGFRFSACPPDMASATTFSSTLTYSRNRLRP